MARKTMAATQKALELQAIQDAKKAAMGRGSTSAPKDTMATKAGGIPGGAMKGFESNSEGGFGAYKTPKVARRSANRAQLRDEYGWRMSDNDYAKMNEGKAQLDSDIKEYETMATKQIASATAQYNENKGTFEAAIKEGEANLASAKETLGKAPTPDSIFNKWFDSTKMKFTVVNADGVKEGTYWVPRALINEQYKAGTNMTFTGKNEALVSVVQGGRTRGQEMHELGFALSNKNWLKPQFFENEKFQAGYEQSLDSYYKAVDGLNSAEREFEIAKSNQSKLLSDTNTAIQEAKKERDHQVNLANQSWEAQVATAREEYQALSQRRELAYASLANMTKEGGTQGNE